MAEHAHPPHAFRLLRLCLERYCNECAANCRYKFSPAEVDCHATLPWGHVHAMEGRYHNGRAALRDFKLAYACSGSWLCENRWQEDWCVAILGGGGRVWS